MSTPFIVTYSVENAHASDIFAVASSPLYTVTAGGDGFIYLWDNRKPSGEPTPLTVEPLKAGVHHLAIDAAGQFAAAVAFDGTVVAFDLRDQRPLDIARALSQKAPHATDADTPDAPKTRGAIKTGVLAGAWACALAGSALAVATLQGTIHVIDIASNTLVAVLTEPTTADAKRRACLCVDISSDGRFVVGGYDEGRTRVFAVETGRLAYSLPSHIIRPRTVKFNPMVTQVAVAGGDAIALFTLAGGSYLGTLAGHKATVHALEFSPNGERLLSVAGDGLARVWALDTRETKFVTNDAGAALFAGAWVPERLAVIGGSSAGFVTAGVDRTVRWYREATGSDF